ncbi:MAG: hypothetical protein ACRDH8_11410 [Actinomycetota bacterium]
MNRKQPVGLLVIALGVTLATAAPATAHEERRQGDHVFVVGWLDEPTYVGFPNAVSFEVAHGDEPAEGEFEVEVIFGDENSEERTDSLPLDPVDGSPGEYVAAVIPTRAGTYTFHITGTLEDGDEVDEAFTSGADTFDEPQDPAGAQFPAEDPTAGELAERLERVDSRLASLQRSVVQAAAPSEEGGDSQILAIIGVVLGALALIGLVALRPRRTG